MSKMRIVAVCLGLLPVLMIPASGIALSISDQFPTFDSNMMPTDWPLYVRFSGSVDTGTVSDSTFYITLKDDAGHIAGSFSFSTTAAPNDTVTFTPDADWPWGERLELHIASGLQGVGGDPFGGTYPFGQLFVANIPNDFEIPVYDPEDPMAMFVDTTVLMGYNPIEPEEEPEGPWMVPGINVTGAWKYTTGRPDVLVAVVDDGLKGYGNPELRTALFINSGELPLPKDGAVPCTEYDCNGDGRFDVDDYANDPRVDTSKEPVNVGHLLEAFSDGIDDDENGLADDICGWDFHRNVNEVLGVDDFPEGAHGDGECRLIAGAANNSYGNLPGICPDCRVLPIRSSESVMYDYGLFAAGVRYAVDMGADLINHAGVALNYSDAAHQAVVDAYDAGVLTVGPQGDEMGIHHWAPAMGEDVVNVKTIFPMIPVDLIGFFNLGMFGFVETYCTNYGTHAHVTVPARTACTSDSTGNTSGAIGLIISYAREQGFDLSAGELFQVLIQSCDDIESHCAAITELLNVCQPGWDEHFGYGRPNIERAMEILGDPDRGIAARIPPDVRITQPKWWETFDSVRQPDLEVHGYIDARTTPFEWALQAAAGKEPLEEEFITVAAGTATEAVEGLIGTVPIGTLFPPDWASGVPESRYDFEVVVRVVARYDDGSDAWVYGEARKAISVHVDDDPGMGLVDGFPLHLGGSPGFGPILYDLDGAVGGGLEVVMATGDGMVHALTFDDAEGEWIELDGFPVDVSGDDLWSMDGFMGSAAVGDLFGDGEPEIVVATMQGKVWAIHHDGNLHDGSAILEGFPVSADPQPNESAREYGQGSGFLASPVLADIDLDGVLEIIAGAKDQKLYAWKPVDFNYDGAADRLAGWPVLLASEPGLVPPDRVCESEDIPFLILGTPAVGILDPLSADPEISTYPAVVAATTEACAEDLLVTSRVYAVFHDGMLHPGGPFLPEWPAKPAAPLGDALPIPLAMGSVASPVIAVGNGETWIGVASAGWFPTVLHYSGGEIHDMYMPSGLNLSAMAHGAFSSLYDDGEIQYIMPLLGVLQFGEEGFNLFNSKLIGNDVVPPHDIAVRGEIEEMPMLNSASMADFSGDGTRNSIIGTGGYLAHAFGVDDTEPPGWPKYTQKWITGTATVGDMDGDGLLEVLLPTYEGWLYAWETTADACPDGVPNSDWPRFHHDPHNTGYYGADVLPPARITDLEITPTDDGNLEAKFTAPGDDWFCGRALEYEVRVSGDMSADLSDVEQFREATIINWNGPPQDPGSPESFIIKGTGIKHAAIQTIDEAGNLSRISNDAANLPDDDDDNDDDAGGGDDDDDDACCG